MTKKYFVLMLVFIAIAVGLLFLPKYKTHYGVNPELLLQQINDPTRFITIDEAAERMLTKDPKLVLIDVRTVEDFEMYALPNAIHIALKDIPDATNTGKLNFPHRDIVFYSNGDLTADQARTIALQHNILNAYVLKGGLNNWYKTIIQATPPSETSSELDNELYLFRKSVAAFFGMPVPVLVPEEQEQPKAESVPLIKAVKKEKEAVEEEGC
ncbi:MAG: rhodanese-like domain-containing protein [Bacteroidota bacterium]